jgi:hypothetical protein
MAVLSIKETREQWGIKGINESGNQWNQGSRIKESKESKEYWNIGSSFHWIHPIAQYSFL